MSEQVRAAIPGVKDGAQHIASVRDGREVYLDGKLVDDVSTHPAYRNAVATAGMLYDHQADPRNLERITFDLGGGRRVNKAWRLPKTYADLVDRRAALVEWAELTCGFLGRSPDHVASSVSGQMMGIEVHAKDAARGGWGFYAFGDSKTALGLTPCGL